MDTEIDILHVAPYESEEYPPPFNRTLGSPLLDFISPRGYIKERSRYHLHTITARIQSAAPKVQINIWSHLLAAN